MVFWSGGTAKYIAGEVDLGKLGRVGQGDRRPGDIRKPQPLSIIDGQPHLLRTLHPRNLRRWEGQKMGTEMIFNWPGFWARLELEEGLSHPQSCFRTTAPGMHCNTHHTPPHYAPYPILHLHSLTCCSWKS